jgi:hypothetical protein
MHLEQCSQVLIIRLDAEYPGPAIAEQRFDDDVLVLEPEGTDRLEIPRNHRWGHELGEVRDQQLLGSVPHRRWVVHHQRVRMDVLQQMGRSDVSHIERRVLAHQHHVHSCEVQQDQLAEAVVGAPLAFDRDRAGARVQTLFATFALPPDALAQGHVTYFVMP